MAAPRHTCPVCAYADLDEPPTDLTGEPTYAICPCCGTQFGADDLTTSHADLRATWIADGARWWSEVKLAPDGWNGLAQLAAAGHTTAPTTAPVPRG
jgi:hypothetical protein